MIELIKKWSAIILAIIALVLAMVSAMKDGELSHAEAELLKEKASEVVDAFSAESSPSSQSTVYSEQSTER